MGRLDRERGGLGFSGAGEQATSQESGLLGGSRQGEPQQTAFPILLRCSRSAITGVDVVLSTVPSFAHHVVGTHSRGGTRGGRAGERPC